MAEEGLVAVEQKLDVVDGKVGSLSTRVDNLSTRVDSLSTRVDTLSTRVDTLSTRVDSLSTRVDTVSTGLDEVRFHLLRVDKRLDKLEVGQEEMKDMIKQVAEGHGATQAAIAREGEMTRAYFDERLVPLEKAVRFLTNS